MLEPEKDSMQKPAFWPCRAWQGDSRDVSIREWGKLVKTGRAVEHSILNKVKAQALEQLKKSFAVKGGLF